MSPFALLVVAVLQTTTSAPPSQLWAYVGTTESTGFAVERASMRASGTGVVVWVASIPKTPQPNQYIGMADYVLSQIRYDCETGVIRVISRVVYTVEGTVGHSSQTPQNEEDAAAPPGTVGATITQLVCQPDGLNVMATFGTLREVRDHYRAPYGQP